MRILITGGAGYVGSVLSHRLWANGHDVTVLDQLLFGGESLLSLLGKNRFKLVRGDVCDKNVVLKLLKNKDAVCHLAAIVGEPACNRNPERAMQINFKGTQNVLDVSQKLGVSRFIFASTCSNYGISDPNAAVDETADLMPISTYSESKVLSEKEILKAKSDQFCPTILRISTAFGVSPRMRFDLLVSDFTLAAVFHRKISVYGEQFWRPFIHVNDISAAIENMLDAEMHVISGQVFNTGTNSSNIRKLDLAHRVCQYVENTTIETVKRDIDPRSYRVDFSKITNMLGFKPKWSIDDGILEVRDAIQAGVWLNPKDSRYSN